MARPTNIKPDEMVSLNIAQNLPYIYQIYLVDIPRQHRLPEESPISLYSGNLAIAPALGTPSKKSVSHA
jgi:hypothetical protein